MTTLAVAGNGAIVPLVEGHAATRERWTVDVTVDDLESLFFYTPANIVVVSYKSGWKKAQVSQSRWGEQSKV